jgi:RNA polymerase sigma-70 factor (ECF subfamily)
MRLQELQPTCEQATLSQLVLSAQQGDRRAFGELVRRYERAVYATVYRRLGNHAEAQEMCQEVFMQALRKIDQLRDPRCFGGWLRSIATRMAINRALRRTPLASTDSEAFEATCVERQTPLGKVLDRERKDQVHLGLDRLGPMDRDTLVAFYFDGRSLLEMSRDFKSPVGTIKRRLHVARRRLAKELAALAPA